jgi:hypothetical protein
MIPNGYGLYCQNNPQYCPQSSGCCSGDYLFVLAHPKAQYQTPAPTSPNVRVQHEQASWFSCFLSLHLGNLWYGLTLCHFSCSVDLFSGAHFDVSTSPH